MSQGRRQVKPRGRRHIRWGRLVLVCAGAAVAVAAGLAAGAVAGIVRTLPRPDPAGVVQTATSYIYDGAGRRVTAVPGAVNRQPLKSLSEVPLVVQHAFIAIEDQRFYSEPGIDPYGIVRAAWQDLLHHGAVQGASTIEQELARNAFPIGNAKTLRRKIQEAILAIELNRRYSKNEILKMYLDAIYFGQGATGIEAASQTYFGHDVSQDTVAQGALLAGLVQEPSVYDPLVHPQLAITRRNVVLAKMAQLKYITAAQARQAQALTLAQMGLQQPHPAVQHSYPYPWYIDAVLYELTNKLGISDAELYHGGLQIYTSLNPKIQGVAQSAISFLDKRFPPNAKPPLQVGLAVIQQNNGDVVALVGGRQHTQELEFNRAIQAERQPGSSIKPLVDYTPALLAGETAATVVDDSPVGYPNGTGGLYVPLNDNDQFDGLTTLREAVRRSVNVVAIKTLDKIGINAGYQTAVRLGLTDLVPADKHLPLAIGGTTHCCTPLEMADSYATLADGGVHHPAVIVREITDAQGNVIYRAKPDAQAIVSPQIAYVMTDILRSVVEPQPNGGWDENWGTAPLARVPGWQTAGKTGTAENDKDAWFVGYTPIYTAAVWLGYDRPRPVTNLFGGSYGAPIFQRIMVAALAGMKPIPFPEPPGIVHTAIDAKSGLLPGPLTPPQWIRRETFIAGTQPTKTSNAWVQDQVVQVTPPGASKPETVLWDAGCPLQPQQQVFLNRPPVTVQSIQQLATVVHLDPARIIPKDMALAPPTQTCTQALGLSPAQNGPGAAGSGTAGPNGPGAGSTSGTPGTPGTGAAPGPATPGGSQTPPLGPGGPVRGPDGVLTWTVTLNQGQSFSPAVIQATQGVPVRIEFQAQTGNHRVAIPTLGVSVVVLQGRSGSVLFTPQQVGSFPMVDFLDPQSGGGRLIVTPAVAGSTRPQPAQPPGGGNVTAPNRPPGGVPTRGRQPPQPGQAGGRPVATVRQAGGQAAGGRQAT